jgi:hypothetical protein
MYLSLHVYSLLYFYPCESVYTEAKDRTAMQWPPPYLLQAVWIIPSNCLAILFTRVLKVITVVRGKVFGAGSYWPKEAGGEQNIR